MITFLSKVLDHLKTSHDLSDLSFILPSKRAGVFLKHELAKLTDQTIFAPEVLSIEEFIQELSGLNSIENSTLLFELYKVYSKVIEKEQQEPFESLLKWGPVLIQDFNEIDRHLAEPEKVFDYMSSAKELDHWSLSEDQTELSKQYLKFWKKLPHIYEELNQALLSKNQGYQGMMYREAVENLESYLQNTKRKKHVIVGFNALNKAEEQIFQEMLQSDKALIFWDIDDSFLKNDYHNAGAFIRNYKETWAYYKSHSFNWVHNNYSEEKCIESIGVSGNSAQFKYAGQLVKEIQKKNPELNSTAIVLGDESQLLPLLHSLPSNISPFNITMGFPLVNSPLGDLFEVLFRIKKNPNSSIYFKDFLSVVNSSFLKDFFKNRSNKEISETLAKHNYVFLSKNLISQLIECTPQLFHILFSKWKSVEEAIQNIKELIFHLSENQDNTLISQEYLYRFLQLFNQIESLQNEYGFIENISSLFSFYRSLLKIETLSFRGEPFTGLQIMGMLESRILDFENIILCSVNEGVLPAGKSNPTFIPDDVKLNYGLPTFKEKDAIYTYHFYRLIQRAKRVYLIYNTLEGSLNSGERSRFITQLIVDKVHNIQQKIASAKIPKSSEFEFTVQKSPETINKLKKLFSKGISVTALLKYVRDPLSFYNHYVLGIKEVEEVEESIAANTFGTIVHNCLDDLYRDFEGSFLSIDKLEKVKARIPTLIEKYYKKEYSTEAVPEGENLIYYEMAKRYVLNFVNYEIELLDENSINIIELEKDRDCELQLNGIDFPVRLKGKVDRIDEFNGVTRIIDYKTGLVTKTDMNIKEWDKLITDYDKNSKAFQVLAYCLILRNNGIVDLPCESGIYSFRNMKEEFLNFSFEITRKNKISDIDDEILDNFQRELGNLVSEILNPEIPFIKNTEIEKKNLFRYY